MPNESQPSLDALMAQFSFLPDSLQRKAILQTQGPLRITAGPGTGKTRVLLWKVANLLLFHQIPPEKIALTTFTQKAAHQLSQGISSILQKAKDSGFPFIDSHQLWVGTVHSLCHRLIKEESHNQHKKPPQILSPLERFSWIRRNNYWENLIQEGQFSHDPHKTITWFVTGKPRSSKHQAIHAALSLFDRFSENPSIKTDQHPILHSLHKMYVRYSNDLRGNGWDEKIDFALLQQKAFQIVQKSSLHPFSHIIVDEYQDTDPIQEALFFFLAKTTGNLCVVGDENQALYQFRGATPENLKRFIPLSQKHFSCSPECIHLRKNYRSKPDIIRVAQTFLGHRTDASSQSHSQVALSQDHRWACFTTHPGTSTEVYQHIAQTILTLRQQKKIQQYSEVAVLFPALQTDYDQENTRVSGMRAIFQEQGIPVLMHNPKGLFYEAHVQQMFGLINGIISEEENPGTLHSPSQFQKWVQQAHHQAQRARQADPKLATLTAGLQASIQESRKGYALLMNQANHLGWIGDTPLQSPILKTLSQTASLPKTIAKKLLAPSLLRATEERWNEGNPYSLVYILSRCTSVEWNLLDLFYKLLNGQNFQPILKQAESGESHEWEHLSIVSRIIAGFLQTEELLITGRNLQHNRLSSLFLSHLFTLQQTGMIPEEPLKKNCDAVSFMTIHKSKGLEFPVVILGSLFRKVHPPSPAQELWQKFSSSSLHPETERANEIDRMFYVAITRARDILVIPQFQQRTWNIPRWNHLFALEKFPSFSAQAISHDMIRRLQKAKDPPMYSITGDYRPYLRCPRNYQAFHHYHFAPSRQGARLFGTLIHRVIENLHALYHNMEQEWNGQWDRPILMRRLRDTFEKELNSMEAEVGRPLPQSLKRLAYAHVENHAKNNPHLLGPAFQPEVKMRLSGLYSPDSHRPYGIQGTIDLLRHDDEIALYDMKTQHPMQILEDWELLSHQLQIYAHMCQTLLGKAVNHARIVSTAHHIYKNSQNNHRDSFMSVDVSPEAIQNALNHFGSVVEAIENQRFSPPPIHRLFSRSGKNARFANQVCLECDLHPSCRSYQKYKNIVKNRHPKAVKPDKPQ